ncbi:MAG: hypothetical protein ACRD24_16790 [Terriglobales bacterium]
MDQDQPSRPSTMSSPPEGGTPWMAILLGGLVLALAIGGVVLLTPPRIAPAPAGPHAYAQKLNFEDLKMTAVENFVGGKVTYLEGKLTNGGDRTVAGVSVETVFRNSLGEVAQKETLPVKVHQQVGSYTDVVDLKAAPLKPDESRGFRLTFDHISADWNRAYPELTVVEVTFQ